MKKRILSILLCGIMAMSLVACGKASSDTGGQKKKINVAKTMEAFKDYYNEYSEKHYIVDLTGDIDSVTANHWDCVGKIIYFENQPMMAIADMTGRMTDENDLVYNVRFYAYEDGNVVEKYTIKDLMTSNYGFSYYVNKDSVMVYTQSYSLYDYAGSVYVLKDNNVSAYNICEDEDTENVYCCDYNDSSNTPVEVDDYIKNSYKMVSLPYNYFINKNDNKALTQEDFTDYLDQLAEQKDIDSESQIVKLYCDYIGYNCGTTTVDAMTSESNANVDFSVNGSSYTFSADNGINELANLPTSVQEYELTENNGLGGSIYSFTGYRNMNGNTLSSGYVDEGELGAILGYEVDGKEYYGGNNFLTTGTSSIINLDNIIQIDKNKYGVLKLDFVDNYEFDNLTKDSSIEEIEKAGFSNSCYEDVYYKIYSDMPSNNDNLSIDYVNLYNSGLSISEINGGAANVYVDYASEYVSLLKGIPTMDGIIDNIVSPYCSINSASEQKYNEYGESALRNLVNKDRKRGQYEDTVKYGLSVAQQMHLLEAGQIDYFIVAEMDAYYDNWKADYEQALRDDYAEEAEDDEEIKNMSEDEYVASYMADMEGYTSLGTTGHASNAPVYKDKILSLYIITNKDSYNSWLEKAGWSVDKAVDETVLDSDENSIDDYDVDEEY